MRASRPAKETVHALVARYEDAMCRATPPDKRALAVAHKHSVRPPGSAGS